MPSVNDFLSLEGWVDNPKAREKVLQSLPMPYFGDINPIKGTGRKKKTLLHLCVVKVAGKFYIYLQEIGDCQNPTDLVRMADGSEKEIQHVQIGEKVITPFGNVKTVLNTIKKPYDKSMVQLTVEGHTKKIASTPDHKYMVMKGVGRDVRGKTDEFEWKPVVSINEGDYVLLPKLINNLNKTYDLNDLGLNTLIETDDFKKLRTKIVPVNQIRLKQSKFNVNRHIELNQKLGFILGAYAAEGSHCKKIIFNLGSHEILFATKLKKYIKDVFNFDAKIYKLKSKPSCLFVSINNILITKFITTLCPGNTYTKNLHKDLLIANEDFKFELLSGYFEGDGYDNKTTVSASKQLTDDMFNIANSLGISCRTRVRKAYKQSGECYELHFNQNGQTVLATEKLKELKITGIHRYTKYGKAAKVKKVEIVKPDTDYVYCIEVEDDHSFICNGYAIHNCVANAQAGAITCLSCIEIEHGELETFGGIIAPEPIYGDGRHLIGKDQISGDGLISAWACQATQKYGTVVQANYEDIGIDLRKYSGARAKDWGSRKGVPTGLKKYQSEHLVKTFSQINSYEEAIDAIASGYPIVFGAQAGFGGNTDRNGIVQRDKNGFAKRGSNWSHSQYIPAADDESANPGLLVVNSWGEKWITGPKPPEFDIPNGSYMITPEDANYIFRQGDSWAISSFDGFPVRKLNVRKWG